MTVQTAPAVAGWDEVRWDEDHWDDFEDHLSKEMEADKTRDPLTGYCLAPCACCPPQSEKQDALVARLTAANVPTASDYGFNDMLVISVSESISEWSAQALAQRLFTPELSTLDWFRGGYDKFCSDAWHGDV